VWGPWLCALIGWVIAASGLLAPKHVDEGWIGLVAGFDGAVVLVVALVPVAANASRQSRRVALALKLLVAALLLVSFCSMPRSRRKAVTSGIRRWDLSGL
jgi:hypothetical protein